MSQEKSQISLGPLQPAGEEQKSERRDAAENRALLLDTAASLFAAHGVENVHMADIAQEAGVGKGTLYRRFANKGDLCLALMDSQMEAFQERMLARLRRMTDEGQSKMAQLDVFIDALVHFTAQHQPLLCEVQRQGLYQGSENLSLPHFWQYMTITGLLQGAAASGEIDPALDIEYVADAILSPLKIDIFRFQREVRGFSLERISAGLRSLAAALRENHR